MKKRGISGLNTSSIQSAVDKLRDKGFQPVFEHGKMKEWRRVRDHQLEVAKVTVHASGRVTVLYRSSDNGTRSQ